MTFDRNFEREYNTGRLYDFMVREEHWKINEYLSSKMALMITGRMLVFKPLIY